MFQVVAPINRLIDTVPFDMYCYSLDWHPQAGFTRQSTSLLMSEALFLRIIIFLSYSLLSLAQFMIAGPRLLHRHSPPEGSPPGQQGGNHSIFIQPGDD